MENVLLLSASSFVLSQMVIIMDLKFPVPAFLGCVLLIGKDSGSRPGIALEVKEL